MTALNPEALEAACKAYQAAAGRNVHLFGLEAAILAYHASEPDAVAVERIGPRLRSYDTCEGCPALRTEDWKDHLENDETDRGTSAKCHATDTPKCLGAYWSNTSPVPKWCPARSQP